MARSQLWESDESTNTHHYREYPARPEHCMYRRVSRRTLHDATASLLAQGSRVAWASLCDRVRSGARPVRAARDLTLNSLVVAIIDTRQRKY